MRRAGIAIPLAAACAALAACGGGGGNGGAATKSRPAQKPTGPPVRVALHAPGHHPKAGRRWPISVRVTDRSGKPLSGVIHYEFLFGGQVVSRQSHYRFHGGRFRDPTVLWPARAVGYPLTFRVVARTPAGTGHADYSVRVRR